MIPIGANGGMSAELRRRSIHPVTTFRGFLEIGSLKINVFSYPLCRTQLMTTPIRVSSLADSATQHNGECTVKIVRDAYRADDELGATIDQQSIVPVRFCCR